MDPNATLADMLTLSRKIMSSNYEGHIYGAADADTLAELVESLNRWITRGGSLPSAWKPSAPVRLNAR